MSRTSNYYLFDDETKYTFDANAIEFVGGLGKLKLQQDDIDFTEEFLTSTGLVLDSQKAEWVGNPDYLVRQKDQRPAGYTLYDNFSGSLIANWGIGTLTRHLQNATVAGGFLDCTGGTPKRAYYNPDNLTNLNDEIVIDITIYPDFNNTPGEITWLVHIFEATANSIQIYMNDIGSIIIRALDNGAGYAINKTIAKSDWIQDQEYRLVLFLKSGDSRAYLDGSLKFTDSNTWDRDTGNPLLYIGSNSSFSANSHFKFGFIYIGTNVDYVTTSVYSSTIYAETTVVLPEMEHTGDGTIKLFNSFTTVGAGAPRYVLQIGRSGDYLYWTGSAWAVSDGSYAQANDQTTFNANCGTLPVDGENYGQFAIIFPDLNIISSVSSITANMNVDIGYLTTNLTIETDETITTDLLFRFIETVNKTGNDNVKYAIIVDGSYYYWDGTAWAISSSYSQSSTATEITTNFESLISESSEIGVLIYLHSDTGDTTPSIDTIQIEYDSKINNKPTVTEIRAELEGYGITSSVLSFDWIEQKRDQSIIPWIEQKTRMSFEGVQTDTEYYNGNGSTTLMLNRRPVVSLVSAEWVEGMVLRDLTQSIELIPDEGMLKVTSILIAARNWTFFERGEKNWKITYTYGYADYPDDIAMAIKLMVASKMLAQIGARTGGGALTVQSHGRNYGSHGKYTDIRKEMVSEALALLRNYMTHVTGS